MKNKKQTRICISCRTKKDKSELIRIVKNKEMGITIDFKQKLEGRGAYICTDEKCFERMIKGNKLKSSLRTNIDNKKYEELRGVIFDTRK